MPHTIQVGVGGWSFEPWNETFYPPGLPAKRQLAYAGAKLTAVEVNATFYRAMPASAYARWVEETPPGFTFCLKAHRFAVTRKTKDDMKEAVDWFLASGVAALGDRLGPINWQFQNKAFDAAYFDAFLSVLPKELDGRRLRHALEVRHPSFDATSFFDMLTHHGATVVWADDDDYPQLRHPEADFAVARLMRTRSDEPTGYSAADIDRFSSLLRGWLKDQDVFAFLISGAKERNPAAAMALQDVLRITPPTAKDADAMATKTPAKKAAKKVAPKKTPSGPVAKKTGAKKAVKKSAKKTDAGRRSP